MRMIHSIFLVVLIISSVTYAQEFEDSVSVYSKNKIYLYGSDENVIVVGKVTELAVVDIQLMNFNDDRFITFKPELDNLFFSRFDKDIWVVKFDFDYLSHEIYPGKQMYLHFYLPSKKEITKNEFYYLTYNGTSDTLTLAPTLDNELVMYVRRFEKNEEKNWYKKMGQFAAFVVAAILGYKLL